MKPPTLFSIPYELREEIYRLAGAMNQRIDALVCDHYHSPALAAVNRQLGSEILPVWREENPFVLNTSCLEHHDQIIWLHHHERYRLPLPKKIVIIETLIINLYPLPHMPFWPIRYFGGEADAYKCDVFLYTAIDLQNLTCKANIAFIDHWRIKHWTWPDREEVRLVLGWQQLKYLEAQSFEWIETMHRHKGLPRNTIKREWIDGCEFEPFGEGRAAGVRELSVVRKIVEEDLEEYALWAGR